MTVSPITRAAVGVPDGFDVFYREYFGRVAALIRGHFPACDAEEIAQETMARCYAKFDELDPHRDPWPWVNTTARNAAIDSMRRNRKLVPADEVPEVSRAGEDATYDAVLVLVRRHSLRTAMKRLRPADRQLLVDHELEGMAYTEMAALRDVTPNALRQQLHRAKGRLAVELHRVGASLGVVPVALHARLGRFTRRANDATFVAGPAGASAFGAMAVAGVATVVTVLGGAAAPTTAAAFSTGSAAEPVLAVERSTARTVAPRAAARQPHVAAVRPAAHAKPAPGDEGRVTSLPLVEVTSKGDPLDNPREEGSQGIRIPLPGGEEVYVETYYETTPGYIVLCEYGVIDCPPPER